MGGSSGGDIVKKKAPVIQNMTPGDGPTVQAAAIMPTPQSSLTDYVPKSRAKSLPNPAGLSGTSLINYQALAARKALESLGVPVSRLGA